MQKFKKIGRLILIFVAVLLVQKAGAQQRKVILFFKHQLEVSAGTGVMNDIRPLYSGSYVLEVDKGTIGYTSELKYKYFINDRFSLGYQFGFFQYPGQIKSRNQFADNTLAKGRLNGFENLVVLDYYFAPVAFNTTKLFFNLYYKIGALSLKSGKGNIIDKDIKSNISISDTGLGLLSGVGIGANYLINDRMVVFWKNDYMHIAGSMNGFYHIDKLFAKTPGTIGHYFSTRFGLNYRLGQKTKKTISVKKKSRRKR